MKVFIYHRLLADPAITRYNEQLAYKYTLVQHLRYLHDVLARFQAVETTDPDEADFFFVPLFLIGWHFAHHDPAEFIKLCEHRDRGRHLLLATGDFEQRAVPRSEVQMAHRWGQPRFDWLDERFTLLALESTAGLHEQDVAFLPWAIRPLAPADVARDLFASFMGRMNYAELPHEHIRGLGMLRLKLAHGAAGASDVLLGTPQDVAAETGRAMSYDEVMQRSVFTLCPAGYGRWTFRFVEALLLGSIPVVLSDGYVLPFASQVDWNDYCVVVPEARYLGVVDELRRIPAARVAELQANILRDRARFLQDGVLDMLCHALAGQRQAA